jgi:leader peptidase (prepilin peptidase) / N-methyltransferase
MIIALFIALCVLLAIAANIDARTQRLPDALNAAIALVGVAFVRLTSAPWQDAVFGAVFGYGVIWGVNAFYRARRGHDGVGMGDAKLLAAGGVWVGWFGVPFVVLIGSSLALALLSLKALRGQRIGRTDRIAFGPYLAAGLAVVTAIQIWLV